jgi:hypothetical protein
MSPLRIDGSRDFGVGLSRGLPDQTLGQDTGRIVATRRSPAEPAGLGALQEGYSHSSSFPHWAASSSFSASATT